MLEKLRLYHTNDLHSHFENWPKIVHYIEQKRNEHEKDGEETLVFDIGDHMDRFQMITEATFGKANVDLLNRLEIDAAAVGNNEGITLPHDELADLYTHAAFPVIVSNLFDADGQRPEWSRALRDQNAEKRDDRRHTGRHGAVLSRLSKTRLDGDGCGKKHSRIT